MFMEERRKEIAGIIEKNGKITVSEITEKYEVSDESARRDLRILEQEGVCKRTHGGAIALQQDFVHPFPCRDLGKTGISDNCREVAREAAKLIQSGDVIYLTGGSFGYSMLSFIPENLYFTVVVNDIDMAKALLSFKNAEVYFTGGRMNQNGSPVDSLAIEFIKRMNFDYCFITGSGFTTNSGLTSRSNENADFLRAVIYGSTKCCLLLPGDRIGTDSFIKVCDANIFDYIITDRNCTEEQFTIFDNEGIYLTVVEEPK